jgi:hemerythrin-like domain-containing protein
MANVHNTIIRGINSMLLQARHIPAADSADFVRFALAFCVLLHEHHETEETLYFPMIDAATGVENLMDKNVVQHEEFSPGLQHFDRYVKQIINGVAVYDAAKFVGLLEVWAESLVLHLTDEIDTLVALEKFDIDWVTFNKKVSEYAVANADKVFLNFA